MYHKTYIGTLNNFVKQTIIKPVYKSYKQIDYDLSAAKIVIVNFVIYNTIYKDIPYHIDNYKLNIYEKNKLILGIKHFDDLAFIVCIKTGNVYVIN